jgi:hypothetical protein
MRDLVIPIEAEDSVTEPSNAGNKRTHSWALQCRGNVYSCRILIRGKLKPTFVSCHQGQQRAPKRVWMLQENLYPSPHRTLKMEGKASIQWDVTLYPKGIVHHTTPSVLCMPWHGVLNLNLGIYHS